MVNSLIYPLLNEGDADGKAGHVDGVFPAGDVSIIPADVPAVLQDGGRQRQAGYQPHRPHRHAFRPPHLEKHKLGYMHNLKKIIQYFLLEYLLIYSGSRCSVHIRTRLPIMLILPKV